MRNIRIPQVFTLIRFYLELQIRIERIYKRKTLDNQLITKGLKYPDPGSNRDGCYSTGV